MKVVINRCHGGFGLSEEALEKLFDRKGVKWEKKTTDSEIFGSVYYEEGHVGDDNFYISTYSFYENRADEDLVAVVEEMGEAANNWASELAVVEIPDNVKWHISEYDGWEHVAEDHRRWD